MRKKAKKKGGCIKNILIFMIVLVAFAAFGGNNEDASAPVPNTVEEVSAEPTAMPSTPEEWVLAAAKEVYKDELISVEWQEVDNQKDMIVIWCNFVDNFTNQMRRDGFMLRAKNMLKRISELGKDNRIEYGSCYIVARTTYLDKYNNEFEGNAMEIRLLEKDLSKLNWDNYMNDETIINLATTYTVHPLFRD